MRWREFTTGFSKKPPEEQGILDSITDTAKDAYEWARDNTAAQTRLLLGMGTEAFGKALNFLGDEDTLAAKYNPSVASTLRSAGDSANNLARGLLTSAADIAPVADYDSPVGAFANQVTGAVHGGIGRMASMLHLDQTADAGYNAAQKTANTAPVSTDDLVEYFTNPRGFISDTGQLAGSMATIVPFMGLLPEATAARGLAALGGDALVQGLVNRGMYGLAKFFANSMPRAVQYGFTSAPVEGAMEGGETRRELLNRGASEEEATRESLIAMVKNVPLLVASNTLEGLTFFSPLRAGNKAVQIGGRGLLNSLQQQYEEFAQQGIQNEALGEPSGWLPWNGAPNQYEAAEHVRYPSLLMGGAGGAIQAYAGDDRQDNWERGSQEKISVGDYSDRANKQGRNLRTWASKISGGQMSDGVFNSIVRNAQELGIDPKLALAQATAESTGRQDVTSPVGAIGVMQLMPSTAAGLGVDPYNQEENIRGGLTYLKQMLDRFNGDQNLALAAYNAGAGAVERYGGIPPYSETQNYVARINGFMDESPEYQGGDQSLGNEGITYLGENGNAEGKYWIRNPNMNVSTEGMRPESLNALDILGKYFFDHTGKPLILNAGTNGDHAEGEFSHANGWKFDIIDQLNGDGALITADYGRGAFLDQFIKFGRSLGLGMNFEGEGTSNVHLDVAVDGTQWDGNGEHAGGFNLDKVRATASPRTRSEQPTQEQPQPKQEQPQQEEQPKPLFDLNSNDSMTQSLLEQFLNERADRAIADNNVQEAEFISGLFDDKSAFQNTPENRQAILNRYGEELGNFVKANTPSETQTESQQESPETKGKAKQEKPYDRNAAIIQAGRKHLDELLKKADETSKTTAWKLNGAIQNNDVATVENILKQNNVAIPELSQAQPAQDAVKGNASPENVLSQPDKKTSEQEKLIKRASQLVTPKTSHDKKQKIGNAIIQLATQNGIAVPAVDFKSLQNGSSKKIKEWQAKLSDVGAFTVQPQQSQTSENAPARPSLKERLNQFLTNAKTTAENQGLNNRVSQTTSAQADDQALQAQEHSQQAGEQAQLGLLQSQTQSVQNQRQQQEAPQPSAQSQAQEQPQETQPQDNEQATQQPTIQNATPESVSEQTQSQIQESATQEQSATESPAQEQPQPQEQENPKPKTLEERLVSKANSPISKHRTARIEHGKAIARLAKKAGVDIPKPVEISLENGNETAIEEARRIINEQINIQTPQQQETPETKQVEVTKEKMPADLVKSVAQKLKINERPKLRYLLEFIGAKDFLDDPNSERGQEIRKELESFDEQEEYTDEELDEIEESDMLSESYDEAVSLAMADLYDEKSTPEQRGNALEDLNNWGVEPVAPTQEIEAPKQTQEQPQETTSQQIQEQEKPQSQEQEAESTQPQVQEQQQEVAQPQSDGRRGNTAEVITGSRKPHQIQYRVVEADELNSSHIIDNGRVFANESFPTEFQPRDRTRSNMQAQLISMGNNLSPNDLLDARDVNQGAPVIRNDGVVLNGNGRTAAIRYAYENGKGESYKKALIDNAQRLGLSADEISKMNRPVLVRELANDLTEDDIRDITGTQTGGARMGASEQAQADAKRISNETLGIFPQSDNVDLTKAESADFLRAALNDIATPDELNSLTTNNGQVNQDGINRVKRAIFALAYGDDGIISRMSESTDDNIRGVTNALLSAAPSISKVKSNMKNGTLHNYNLSAITDAAKKLSSLRDEGKTVSTYLQEQSLFAEHADSEEMKEILSVFDRFKRSPKKIAAFLNKIASNIQAQGNPNQLSLFGANEPAPLMDIIKRARAEVENNGEADIFAQEQQPTPQNTETQESPAPEAEPTSKQESSKPDTVESPPKSQETSTTTPETSKPQEKSEVTETQQTQEQPEQEHKESEQPPGKQPKEVKTLNDLKELASQITDSTKRSMADDLVGYAGQGVMSLKAAAIGVRALIDPSSKTFPRTTSNKVSQKEWRANKRLLSAILKRAKKFNIDEDALEVLKILSRLMEIAEKDGRSFSGDNMGVSTTVRDMLNDTNEPTDVNAPIEAKHQRLMPYLRALATDNPKLIRVEFNKDVQDNVFTSTYGIEKLAEQRLKEFLFREGVPSLLDALPKDSLHPYYHMLYAREAYEEEAQRYKEQQPSEETTTERKEPAKTDPVLKGLEILKKISRGEPVSEQEIADLKTKPIDDEKFSMRGDGDTTISKFVDPNNLTPQQKMIQSFGEKLGVKTVFFDNADGDFHGAYAGNISYINVNSNMPLGKVFWHESMHWLKASNPKLYQQLVKAAGITDEQRQTYLKDSKRKDLKTNAAIDEEIIADQFEDVAKRNGLLQSIAGKNRGLVERVVQWLKDTMNKFIEFFHNPQGKLTTKQAQALADEFGKIASRLIDPNGERIFRYNSRTGNLETIGGRSMAKTTPLSEVSDIKYTFAGKKAKTANKESLARAKKMDERGVDRNRIYEATGWFKGEDDKWRFEIPDNREQMHLNNLFGKGRLGKYFHLPDVYDNPQLYAAYPKLQTISVIAVDPTDTGLEAVLVKGSDAVTIGNKIIFNVNRLFDEMKEAQKTLVHEIQHKIQDYEKFSSGGNYENIKDVLETNKDKIMHSVDKIPDGKKYFDAIFAVKKAMKRDNEQAEVKARQKMTQAKQNLSTKDRKDIETLAERFYKLSNVNIKTKSAKISAYYRLGGEQEARHVEERLDNHEGTPIAHDDDALIVFGGKTYPLHKKNASEKGDGELVEGSIPRSAAAANGTTDTAVKKITAGSDNKGGVSSAANVETNSPKQSISQGAGKIKYSIGRSDNSSESLTQKIRNAFSSWWKGGAKKNRNREITDLLYRVTGYKVDFGNVKDADKTIIDDVHKVIRTKHAYEWDKLLPQIGGKIAKSLKLNPTQEMSNYIADWCLTGAVGNSSAEAKAFEKAMRDDPVTAGLMLQIRDAFQEFNDMTSEQKIGDTLVSRLQGKAPKEIVKELWSEKEEQISDDLHPVLRQINDMIAKAEKTSPTLAKMMKEDIDPYKTMRLLRGIGGLGDLMIHGDAKNIEDVRDQFRAIYPRLKFDRLNSLDAIIQMAGGEKHIDGLMKYAVAKLDKEMHEKLREDPDADIRPQFSEAVDDDVIKAGEKQYADAHRALVTYSNILACIQHDSGLISGNQLAKMLKGWKNYVPMIRVFEEGEDFKFEDSLKHKTGSQRSTYTPLETLQQHTYDVLSRAERNKAKQQLAFYARIGEFGDIIQEVETSNPGNNVITYREGGKIKYLKVFDPAVKRAVDNIYSPADTSWIMKFLRATMSFMRNMRTMASVDFAIGNPFRNTQDAYIHNRHADANPLKALLDVFREGFKGFGIKRMFREKSLVPHDTDWVEFQALGGTQSTFVSEDVDQLRRSTNRLYRKPMSERFNPFKSGITGAFKNVLDTMQWLSEQTEYMTRLNSYKRAKAELAKQRPDGKATLEDKRLAALEARDASIDFAKSGSSTRKVNQLLMFANAQVQDWAKWGVIGRDLAKGGEARKVALQKVGRLMLQGIVTTLAFAALNYSDDDRKEKYKKRPDWEKETYWIFGDGLRIPKGQDVATRFVSALTDEFIGKAMDDDPVSTKRLLKVFRDAVPSIIPTLIEPAYEVRMNYSAFRDAPIVPVGQQRLAVEEQYGKYTSSFAKLFSEMTGLTSPRGVDYLINNYLGTTGRFVTRIPDFLTRGMTLNDALMLRRFVFDPAENTKTVKEYYEAYDEQYKHYNTYKLRRKWDKNAKPHEDFDPKLFSRLKAAQDPLQNISKKENEILRNPKLDWDTKNKKLRELEKKREKICEKVMRQAR